MKFIKEMLSQFSFGADTSLAFQYYVICGCGGYFQNIKSVAAMGEREISLISASGIFTVEGENLVIKKYCDGDMLIEGNIIKVEKV